MWTSPVKWTQLSLSTIALLQMALVGSFPLHSSCGPRGHWSRARTQPLLAQFDVALTKPMGIVFEENVGKQGLYVFELSDGGKASLTDITENDQLVMVNKQEVFDQNFDEVMEVISSAPSPTILTFFRGSRSDFKAAGLEAADLKASDGEKASSAIVPGPTNLSVQQEGKDVLQLTSNKEVILRSLLTESKVDIYTFVGKMTNCNGGGQCGTCVVDVLSSDPGALAARTPAEERHLKGKSPTYRLACQCVLQGGDVTIQTKPS